MPQWWQVGYSGIGQRNLTLLVIVVLTLSISGRQVGSVSVLVRLLHDEGGLRASLQEAHQ